VVVANIWTGAGDSHPDNFTTVMNGTRVAMSVKHGLWGREPWITDGTWGGTKPVGNIAVDDYGSFPHSFTPLSPTHFVFVADDDDSLGFELYVSDGSTYRLVANINPGSGTDSDIRLLTSFEGQSKVVFYASDGTSGREPWVSDGTPGGTFRLVDINSGPGDSNTDDDGDNNGFVQVGSLMYFRADNGSTGLQLWATDGTEAGTRLVKVIVAGAGGGYSAQAAAFQNLLYFAAAGIGLWTSDGTESGTRPLVEGVFPTALRELTAVGKHLYFSSGSELWVSDGTAGGTAKVGQFDPARGPQGLVAVNSQMLAFWAQNDTVGREIFLAYGAGAGPDTTGPVTGIGFAPVPIGAGDEGALTATANEENTGGSLIADTEFQIDGGSWSSMAPLDGNYDSILETGIAMVTFPDMGTHQACVRGIDQSGNIGVPICMDIEVTAQEDPPIVLTFSLIPDTPIVQGLQLELEALASDVNRGDKVIIGAEYRIDAGFWVAMMAFDGAFDSELEQIQGFADTSSLEFGTHTACIQATQFGGKTSAAVCKDFEVVLVGELDDFMVSCMHEPLWPKSGDTVSIDTRVFKIPTDGQGTPFGVEKLEIWFDDKTGPKWQQEGTGLWSFNKTSPKLFKGSFTYGCRARHGDKAVFSGWRTVAVGSLPADEPIPVIYTGPSSHRVDIVFVADEDSYTGSNDPDFLLHIGDIIRNSFYRFELYNRYQHLFNFWLSRNTGAADKDCVRTRPVDWVENYAFSNAGAIIHTDRFRDCAGATTFSVEFDEFAVVRHEAGHKPFGLADEYCCDGGYFEQTIFPNVYKTLDSCEADAPDLGRLPADCRSWDSTDNEKTYYSSEPAADDLMRNNKIPNAADIRRIEWMFEQCRIGSC